jgi:hypothetical protein
MAQEEYFGGGLALHDQQAIHLRNGFKSSLEESATAIARRVRTTVAEFRYRAIGTMTPHKLERFQPSEKSTQLCITVLSVHFSYIMAC